MAVGSKRKKNVVGPPEFTEASIHSIKIYNNILVWKGRSRILVVTTDKKFVWHVEK